jgi:hypothetical protein
MHTPPSAIWESGRKHAKRLEAFGKGIDIWKHRSLVPEKRHLKGHEHW